jgi:hypothetical protein
MPENYFVPVFMQKSKWHYLSAFRKATLTPLEIKGLTKGIAILFKQISRFWTLSRQQNARLGVGQRCNFAAIRLSRPVSARVVGPYPYWSLPVWPGWSNLCQGTGGHGRQAQLTQKERSPGGDNQAWRDRAGIPSEQRRDGRQPRYFQNDGSAEGKSADPALS